MEFILITLLNGLSYGLLLFMLSSGLTLIFSMMGVLNFAHTSFYMLGAYLAYSISGVIGFWPALVIAPLLVALIGVLQTFAVSIDQSLASGLQAVGVPVGPQTFGHELLELSVAQVAPILPFLLLVLMLIFRPRGLLGKREN